MVSIDVLLTEPIGTIHRNLYGHFVEHLGNCIYEGVWQKNGVCESLVGLLKRIGVPVIRWPGGCFADDYHWRDGVGPKEARPRRVNINWGNVIEDNSFGTHEFVRLCREVGAEPYISGNVGSGTPGEMRDWVEYCNQPGGSTLAEMRAANGEREPMGVKYWGVGNEAWGCGGHFSPEDYAGEFRRYSTFLRDFGDTPAYVIACGPDGNDLDWTRRFFEKLFKDYRKCGRIHGYAAHYYCGTAGTATRYTEAEWYALLWKAKEIETLIVQQRGLMDAFDPERKVGLIIDEWGTWHPPATGRNPAFLWQQNTLRDGLVAAITLDTFNRQADKVVMANIAQLVNVLQALFLVEHGKVVTTPTYHVFEMYRNHQEGRGVRVVMDGPQVVFTHGGVMKRMAGLSGSASIKGKTLTLTVVNARVGEPTFATINLRGDTGAAIVRETVLTAGDIQAHNTFEEPGRVRPTEPRVVGLTGSSLRYAFAGQSVTRLEMGLV